MKIVLTALILLALSLPNTKPDSEAYLRHVVWKLKETDCKAKPLSNQAQLSCTVLETFPPSVSRLVLQDYTHRQDYFFFSVYQTDFSGLHDRSVGVAGQFF